MSLWSALGSYKLNQSTNQSSFQGCSNYSMCLALLLGCRWDRNNVVRCDAVEGSEGRRKLALGGEGVGSNLFIEFRLMNAYAQFIRLIMLLYWLRAATSDHALITSCSRYNNTAVGTNYGFLRGIRDRLSKLYTLGQYLSTIIVSI